MIEGILCRVPVLSVFDEQVTDQVFAIFRHCLEGLMIKVEFPFNHIPDDLQLVPPWERYLS